MVQSQSSSVLLRDVAAASQVVTLPAPEVQLAVPVPARRAAVIVVLYPSVRRKARRGWAEVRPQLKAAPAARTDSFMLNEWGAQKVSK